jgi:hypothetical protein
VPCFLPRSNGKGAGWNSGEGRKPSRLQKSSLEDRWITADEHEQRSVAHVDMDTERTTPVTRLIAYPNGS